MRTPSRRGSWLAWEKRGKSLPRVEYEVSTARAPTGKGAAAIDPGAKRPEALQYIHQIE